MIPAIVRIGERNRRVQALFAAWARGKKARFADLHALRHGSLPAAARVVSLRRQLAVIIGAASGSACVAGYGLAVAATMWSHADRVDGATAGTAAHQAEAVVAPADLTFDVTRLIGTRDSAVDQVIAERTRASLDRDRAAAEHEAALAERDTALSAERDAARAERDAALDVDRKMLLELHARTSRTIAEIESILSATGIDPAHVLKANGPQDRTRPRGGPFVPWNGQAVRDGGSEAARRFASLTSGVERLAALRDLLSRMPLASPLAQLVMFDGFGFRLDPFSGRPALHEGVDLRGTTSTPVMATADGTVAFAGWHPEYGNMVEIYHGYGITTRYAHLSRIVVKPGAPVTLHQQLGFVGATGRVTATHLHYEVRVDGHARNPVNFFKTGQNFFKAGQHVSKADHAVAQKIPDAEDAFAGFNSGQGAPDFRSAVDR
jgi:murein DD-endopeptidase MepM/ murein hydrolase activator NlpD